MEFENEYLEKLTSNFYSFSVEGFNIFALGSDHLPHLICACPNKDFARAICAMLEIAKRARNLKVLDAKITSHCRLVSKILAEGSLDMAASLFDQAAWKDGDKVEYDKLELALGTLEYQDFVSQFLDTQEEEGGS